MNRKGLVALIVLAILAICTIQVYSWGFFAHKRINRLSVFTLPAGMIEVYKVHIEYLTENAVAPDKRRYGPSGSTEAPRHYIDIDHYGESPFDSMPRYWKDAVHKYTEDTLQAYGIVPWHIARVTGWLSEAFRDEDLDKVLRLSADLGHYISDAHVPLHTTLNYNGKMTNQKGIHGFWESRLPELLSDDYDYFVGKAIYIEDPLAQAWEIVEESFAALDSVLLFEEKLNAEWDQDKKYSYEQRGQKTVKVYSREYSEEYHKRLDGQVERRLRSSIHFVGSYWYTAWVNAGKPDLKRLSDKELSKEARKKLKEEEDMWRSGKIKGREHE
ncbi:MAG: S1/P1 Nuclease [Bacteroidetes bacterium]|nr:MAG: S1/P1 Nuclease [Bacteroidota bacterium]